MAAEESAQFQHWSATTNVTDAVLEQMTADVTELAWGEQIDPPALTYARTATLFTRAEPRRVGQQEHQAPNRSNWPSASCFFNELE
ncbi:MAG: hypothetical protein ACT4NY_30450 [Pseudonocardiales bacterium]